MRIALIVVVTFVALLLCMDGAFAQRLDNRTIMSRIDRMERDIMFLQRQASQQGSSRSYGATGGGVNAARSQASLEALSEDIRKLRGQLEEQDYHYRTLQTRIERLAEDLEHRLTKLEGGNRAQHSATSVGNPPFPAGNTASEKPVGPAVEPPVSLGNEGMLTLPEPKQSDGLNVTEPDSPREHYNKAFRLLNQTRYSEAGTLFKSFIGKYQDSPLVGNAWYWLGESYYVRRNYVQAADSFRQGFEALPDGPKASDNLLKLGMSLAALDRGKEACVVLRQLNKKYGGNSVSIRKKSGQEMNRIGCE